MEREQIAGEILAMVTQILQIAGPEGTLEALGVLLEEMSGNGMDPMAQPAPMRPQAPSGPMGMPAGGPRNALSGQ